MRASSRRRARRRPRPPAISAAEWVNDRPIEAIAGERDLFGDGRIVLIPLSGHTPGSIGAHVTLDRSGAFLLASDTVSLRATLDRGIVPRNTWNADALVQVAGRGETHRGRRRHRHLRSRRRAMGEPAQGCRRL